MARAMLRAALCTAAAAAATADDAGFASYKARFGKAYASAADEERALGCWRENAAKAVVHAAENPLASFGETVFSDQCWEDFRAERLMAPRAAGPSRQRMMQPAAHDAALHVLASAGSVDWREKGALNPVQDQGKCGSCWAFGTLANTESQHFLWGGGGKPAGKLIKLSEQELVSCSAGSYDLGGCNGGLPHNAFAWMKSAWGAGGGLTTAANYPYTSGNGTTGKCIQTQKKPAAFTIHSYQDLAANETYVAAYVAKYGPVVIGAEATPEWHSYRGGILSVNCTQKSENHNIAIIGYGSEGGNDYWLIRNSWGVKWGEEGHLRIARGVPPNCNGVVAHVSSVLFDSNADRSLCLQACQSGEKCCHGDCCRTGKDATCCPGDNKRGGGGCCESPSVCCGGECCNGKCVLQKCVPPSSE